VREQCFKPFKLSRTLLSLSVQSCWGQNLQTDQHGGACGCGRAHFRSPEPSLRLQEVREPLEGFQYDQLQRIFSILGTPTPEIWHGLEHSLHWQRNSQSIREVQPGHTEQLEAHLVASNPSLASEPRKDAAVDLLRKCVSVLAFVGTRAPLGRITC
jgi:hypothetical protein